VTTSSRRYGDHLDEQVGTVSFTWREDSWVAKNRLAPVPLKACRQVHHAGVVGCAIFAARNSLKSHVGPNLKSPYRNIRSVTSKLCRRPDAQDSKPAAHPIAVSFIGGFRTTAPARAASSRWAVIRNPSQKRSYDLPQRFNAQPRLRPGLVSPLHECR